ncbi:MAG: DNA gyrase subunit A [Candidatus Lambdaproteobacteria bacterium RIFOXYD1_FULL_56_27]|uniref:DNA gyrase subunit A n=1 Tax=Candidatus Lambdaproteobacteria bacterium RIFOXYD2_FULL_56_26 TaxID=1817773 RepID=A0A1F6GQ39_9PROT|nr:MAG: DNA gyrase subunit A [Candidatus Lambdaproteobacteria bacterium RIFOXYD2_FULL_56_26]OGH03685.1 MAG: DNA gyrase subunit A [Candidatus Lambdaproteobacteria bacterium RIFOXYC1_FULL_56_13]OGH07269.1 MAG: DNA gyrase subunit A [Candidatus Lambdaproteobacteria bacterium RIFOXYD1_FULL_56_27]
MTTQNAAVTPVNIEDSMRSAYLEYAMSVIVGRALPDVRDGLKPVHRRILFAMHDMNLAHNRPYMKSARVVGEVIGKYHPHGDTAVYDASVRMVQTFSMRNPLIDGQGNFGSVDGDSPAAMRYTEVRLQRIASEFLGDLDKNTVDFVDNYDGSLKEPSVLPTKVPNLLLNGSTGIAVGMATNIPPHNLSELIDGLLYFIDNRLTCQVEDLLPIIKGPDFPTAGQIMGREGITSAYKTGRGILRIRAKADFEELKGGRQSIIVTELPYQVNKARLIEKIAELVKDKKLEGISDLRDESDRKGMRVVIELKRDEIPETVLANLFKHTAMQSTFGVITLAVVDGQPKILTLVEVLRHFLSHRIDVVVRRTQFELKKALDRAHILEGLKKAQENIDKVIQLIRQSPDAKEAKEGLISRFELSDLQAQAILDMRLQRLTAMEVDKLNQELAELTEKIKWFKEVLADENLVLGIIKDELREIKELYPSERRTQISENYDEISQEDLIPVEEMVVTMSRGGYIKRLASDTYKIQHRGGKGKIAMTTKETDDLEHLFVASSHDTLLIFTSLGKVFWKKVYELPQASRTAKGRAWVNILALAEDERVVFCTPIQEYREDQFVLMVTEKGVVKKTELTAYQHSRTSGTKAIVIDEGDLLKTARLCTEDNLVFIATKNGMAAKFPNSQIRPQGRVTRGCRGINLKENDEVIGLEALSGNETILTVTEKGYGKKTDADEYRLGSRGNMGVMNIKSSPKIGRVVASVAVAEGDELLLITQRGKIIRLTTDQIRETTRVTMGVRLINLEEGERVVSVAKIDGEKTEAVDEP